MSPLLSQERGQPDASQLVTKPNVGEGVTPVPPPRCDPASQGPVSTRRWGFVVSPSSVGSAFCFWMCLMESRSRRRLICTHSYENTKVDFIRVIESLQKWVLFFVFLYLYLKVNVYSSGRNRKNKKKKKKKKRERERKREWERERRINFVQIMLTSGFFSVLQCPSLNITLILLIWQQLSFSLFKKKKNWNYDNIDLFLLFIIRRVWFGGFSGFCFGFIFW